MMKIKKSIPILIFVICFLHICIARGTNDKPVKDMVFGASIADVGILDQSGAIDTYDITKAVLNATKETGSDIARIFLFYESWIINHTGSITRINKLINDIKSSGLELMIANQGTPSFEKNPVSWDRYRETEFRYVKFFTEKYKPDYYIVTIEPYLSVTEKNLNEEPTVDEFIAQTQKLVDIIKEISPTTKTGISVVAGDKREEEFYHKCLQMKNLDIIGLDMYPHVKEVKIPTLAYSEKLIKEHPHSYGKELWVLETWNDVYSSFIGGDKPNRKNEDAEWIRQAVNFAQEHNFDGFVLYYGQHFITYVTGWYGKKIDTSERTPAFYEFKQLINDMR